jgi:hypothetical protein
MALKRQSIVVRHVVFKIIEIKTFLLLLLLLLLLLHPAAAAAVGG